MLLIRNANVFAPCALGVQNLLLGGGKILWMGPGQDLAELPSALREQGLNAWGYTGGYHLPSATPTWARWTRQVGRDSRAGWYGLPAWYLRNLRRGGRIADAQ